MDLSTSYLGLQLPHPFVAGASPLADSIDSARRVEDGGGAAIVMRSLFEEQLASEAISSHHAREAHTGSFAEALSYMPDHHENVVGPDEYLDRIRRLKEALDIPVIASLNGTSPGGWLRYASLIEEAGADALELNIFDVVTDVDVTADEVELRSIEMVGQIRSATRIPIAVKLSPFHSSLANYGRRLVDAGAAGLVIFNRFYDPEIDVEALEVTSHMELSDSSRLLPRLRWLAILSGRAGGSLAVSGGVHTARDAVKAVMCGAHAVQLVSALMIHGPGHLGAIHRSMVEWMEEKEYESLAQMRGSMNIARCPDPKAYERANYLHALQTWSPPSMA